MTIAICIILTLIAVLLWIALAATALTLNNSDPAGNALASAFAAIEAVALWSILTILLLIATNRVHVPAMAGILLPASGVAVQVALGELRRQRGLKWLAVVPLAIPGLMLAYVAWCFMPVLRSRIGWMTAAVGAWAPILLLVPAPWIAIFNRERILAAITKKTPEQLAVEEALRKEEYRQQRAATFHSLTSDSSFWEWWGFTKPDSEFRQAALEGARQAKNRQEDVAGMLSQGHRDLFLAVPQLDLAVTPAMEQGVRAFLKDQVVNLAPYDPARPITTQIAVDWMQAYLPTIQWLVDRGGSCNDELAAIAEAVGKYPDSPERERFIAALDQLHAG